MDGFIFEVVLLGRHYGVHVPAYEMIAGKIGFKA
jgi:2-dehydropantoate 2-reductase